MKESKESVPPTLFDDLLLYFCDSTAIDNPVSGGVRSVHCRFNSRRQLIYRIAHGFAEVVKCLPIHSPVESSTDIGTEQSEFDVILFVDHRILVMCELGTSRRR